MHLAVHASLFRLLLLVRSHVPCKSPPAIDKSVFLGAALTPFSLAQTVRDTALQAIAGAGLPKGEAEGMTPLSFPLAPAIAVCFLLHASLNAFMHRVKILKPCIMG